MAFYDTWPKVDPIIVLVILCLIVLVDRIWEMILTKRQVSGNEFGLDLTTDSGYLFS